jgi:hypothetical protein
MPYSVRRAEYYRTTVADHPEEAYRLLSDFAALGINLLAFTAVPLGPDHVQLTLFPDDVSRMEAEAKRAGLKLDGPHPAIMVQGADELGVLAGLHQRLADASVPAYASSGITAGSGSFGYLVYVREDQFDRAMEALTLDEV